MKPPFAFGKLVLLFAFLPNDHDRKHTRRCQQDSHADKHRKQAVVIASLANQTQRYAKFINEYPFAVNQLNTYCTFGRGGIVEALGQRRGGRRRSRGRRGFGRGRYGYMHVGNSRSVVYGRIAFYLVLNHTVLIIHSLRSVLRQITERIAPNVTRSGQHNRLHILIAAKTGNARLKR